jgi:hypothetical protein
MLSKVLGQLSAHKKKSISNQSNKSINKQTMDKKQTTIDKLAIYNQLANTPQEARKEISAGRLKGMTDINPMWRKKIN